MQNDWDIQNSNRLFKIDKWSDGHFSINEQGELIALAIRGNTQHTISLPQVIEEVKKRDLGLPIVLRFHDILRSQVIRLNENFKATITEANYQGNYFGVYPIKVNQLREVIEEIVDVGQEYNYGLEAGSKTELLTVLAYNTNPNSLTILNGYKDKEYLKLAILGHKLGKKTIIVIEKFSEILTLLELIENTDDSPTIGVRVKLSTKSSGPWADSCGDFAKFGLSVTELLEFVELLKSKDKLHLLKLFHFHSGSQIPDIRTLKECLTEAARFYTELCEMGAPLEYFDAGGGVGINYEASSDSINYTLENYIADVVYILKDICDEKNIAHPNIVTETGRAIAAFHSCVITNVFGNVKHSLPANFGHDKQKDDHLILKKMKDCHLELNAENYLDIFNDACLYKDEAISAFKLGVINLSVRSLIESLYWHICHQILEMTKLVDDIPAEIEQLKKDMAQKYLCNFSLFQSAPDSWAIDQILPVVPIERLNEKPEIECTLADITCDSDGKISKFNGENGATETLPIHNIEFGKDYNIGLFLTGAYQDTMGDMHNLFGRLNEAHVFYDPDDEKGFYIEEIIRGNSAADVLEIMQYNPKEMSRKIKLKIDKKVKEGVIKPRDGFQYAEYFNKSLQGYTYLE